MDLFYQGKTAELNNNLFIRVFDQTVIETDSMDEIAYSGSFIKAMVPL